MNVIIEPKFPPLEGYVETVDAERYPIYQPTLEQHEKENQQALLQKLRTENVAFKTQLTLSDDAAIALFEAQAATDAAIINIYEKIGG